MNSMARLLPPRPEATDPRTNPRPLNQHSIHARLERIAAQHTGIGTRSHSYI
jgi:hypothetical protein